MSYLRKKLLGITAVLTALTGVAFGQTVEMVTADITTNTTWSSDTTYILTDIIYVDNDATLTIEPGTIIRGEQKASGSFDPGSLVVTRGATLNAEGTESEPIIWCSAAVDNDGDGVPDLGDDLDSDGTPDFKDYEDGDTFLDADPVNNPIDYSYRGLWGGLIILGNATTNVDSGAASLATGENFIEGLPDPASGGDLRGVYGSGDPANDTESSGIITYNSVRNGGSNLAADNEINGITMGGVGSGTTLEHCEVFANLDDGYEWFGGTVNSRWLVSAFNDDDAFDIDEGWRGKNQWWFSIIGSGDNNGEHGGEHDGGTDPQDGTPLANTMVANATYLGAGTSGGSQSDSGGFQLRDNWGGSYWNSIFMDFTDGAMDIEDDTDTPARLAAGEITFDGNIWWNMSLNTTTNVFDNTAAGMASNSGVDVTGFWTDAELFAGESFTNDITNPMLASISRLPNGGLDPRPGVGSPAISDALTLPADPFWTQTSYRGAFGSDLWIEGWTVLDALGFLGTFDNELGNLSTINPATTATLGLDTRAGFIVNGTNPATVVVRGRGPTLPGEAATVSDTILQVYNQTTGELVAENDDWASAENVGMLTGTSLDPNTAIGGAAMAETESILVLTLDPGGYTMVVLAKGDESARAIAEVFITR